MRSPLRPLRLCVEVLLPCCFDSRMRPLLLLLPLLLPLAVQAAQTRDVKNDDTDHWVERARQHVYSTVSSEDEKGFERLAPPKPGDWLHTYRERPQTLERYQLAAKIRPEPERRTLVLQPLGILDDEKSKVLQLMREYAEVFFQLPVRIEKPLDLASIGKAFVRNVPLGNRHGTYDKQYNAEQIMLQVLVPRLPEDAVIYLGITMEDLYCADQTFVFGLGTLGKRVGVYSLCRYFPEFWGRRRHAGDEIEGLRRSCKVLNHEAGHMFGITHCIFYRCSMNGSNSLAETDAAPMHYCPVCHRKLHWNLEFDPLKRYASLEAFYRKNQLVAEADWMSARLDRWKTLPQKPRPDIPDE